MRPARLLGLVVSVLCSAGVAGAAPPVPPSQLSYQGVLLDDLGEPRTGNVDLHIRIYDALSGGTKLYTQTFASVPLTDGVFAIELGPTGVVLDPPTDPLTTSLLAALAGDLGATGPDRFLEVTVGTEGALSRTQILTVPYALLADEANHATTADVAVTADAVGGVTSSFVTQLFNYGNSDLSGPTNSDPSEGLGDTDLDGIANFVDNDNDSLTDSAEVIQGSDINAVTPIVTQVVPANGLAGITQTVTIQGGNFDPGQSVVFGSQTPTSMNLVPDSFEVVVGPQQAGQVDIQVTLPNFETDAVVDGYEFDDSLPHTVASDGTTQMSFAVADEFIWAVGGQDEYSALGVDSAFESAALDGQLAVAINPAGNLVGLRCRATGGDLCDIKVTVDSDADFELTDETPMVIQTLGTTNTGRIYAPSITFDPSGNIVAGYVHRDFGTAAVVIHDRTGDGDFDDANEFVAVPPVFIENATNRADIAVDPTGRAALAFMDSARDLLQFAWDRSGDGDFEDTVGSNPEVIGLFSASDIDCVGAAFASDGDPVVVYSEAAAGVVMRRDLNQDGDFLDAGEDVALSAAGSAGCHVAGGNNDLTITFVDATNSVRLLIDRNDDGDFDDTDENLEVTSSGSQVGFLNVAHNASGRAFVAMSGGSQNFIFPDDTP